jgi:hypothetical protein
VFHNRRVSWCGDRCVRGLSCGRCGLPTCGLSRHAIGISRKLIAVNSLIEKPCLCARGCHPIRELAGSDGSPSIIHRRLRRYVSAPSAEKCLLPIHFRRALHQRPTGSLAEEPERAFPSRDRHTEFRSNVSYLTPISQCLDYIHGRGADELERRLKYL